MATTITRTAWTDDDGSGTTGTIINNAVKTSLYDQIDGIFAGSVVLGGGLTIAGALAGVTTVNASGIATFTGVYISVAPTTGTNAGYIAYTNTSGTMYVGVDNSAGSTFFTGNTAYSAVVNGATSAGLSIAATHASGAMRFYTGGTTERMRIFASGAVSLGTATDQLGPGQLTSTCANQNLTLVSSADTSGAYYAVFAKASGAEIGSIRRVTSTDAVQYNTSSDARLKRDRGVVTQTDILSRTIIHDFEWLSNGSPARGVFAQEAASVAPFAVSRGTDDRTDAGELKHPWAVDYSKYVPDLIVGWQQHDATVQQLAARIAALEGSH